MGIKVDLLPMLSVSLGEGHLLVELIMRAVVVLMSAMTFLRHDCSD